LRHFYVSFAILLCFFFPAYTNLPPELARRTLRSGKEFSQFDLAVGAPIEPAEFFDVEECLASCLDSDEPAEIATPPFWVNTPSSPQLPFCQPTCTSAPTALKAASKRRRRDKRAAAAAATGTEVGPKSVSQKHLKASLRNALTVDVDAADLSHSKPAWIGLRSAESESEDGMGGRTYTHEEIESLTGANDLIYINWLGRWV
jgi:hypothetical protein